MKPGKIILFKFPQANLYSGKLRPALVLKKMPGKYDDWLICMISSKTIQLNKEYDLLISEDLSDYKLSGLKSASVIRATRLAVVNKNIFIGSIGNISSVLLDMTLTNIVNWLNS